MSSCAQCGSEYVEGQRFCAACGAPLSSPALAAASAGPAPDQEPAASGEQTQPPPAAAPGSSPSFETIPTGRRFRVGILVPIIASAAVLVLAGAGFGAYWLLAGGSSRELVARDYQRRDVSRLRPPR